MEIVNGFKSRTLPEQDPGMVEALSMTRTITAKEFLEKGTSAAMVYGMNVGETANYLAIFAALIFLEED